MKAENLRSLLNLPGDCLDLSGLSKTIEKSSKTLPFAIEFGSSMDRATAALQKQLMEYEELEKED